MVYFTSIPDDLSETISDFVEQISDNLEYYDLSLLDRPNCVVLREQADSGDWIRVNLPHRQDADFDLHLHLKDSGCTIYFADAHMHFDHGDDWQEGAMGFLSMLLFGHVESRAHFIGKRLARVDVFIENPNGEWELAGAEIYPRGNWFGLYNTRRRRACFASEQDFERLALAELPDDGIPQLELPDCKYFKKRPAELPPKALEFFELLSEQLEKHQPPQLDERRTRAYLGKDSEGVEYLCISLPHKIEKKYYLGADVYPDHCVLLYGNGRMDLDGAEWLDVAGGMLGELLFGQIEVRSIYRGDRLVAVTTRFLSIGKRGRSWTRRWKRISFGKKRVDVKRVNYFEDLDGNARI